MTQQEAMGNSSIKISRGGTQLDEVGETGPRAAGSVPCIVLPRISERFVEDPWTQALFR